MASPEHDLKPRIGHDPFDEGLADWVRSHSGGAGAGGEDVGVPQDGGEDGRDDEAQALLVAALPEDLPAAVVGIERGRGMDGPRRPSPPPGPQPRDAAPDLGVGQEAALPPLVSIGEVLRAEDRRAEATFSFPSDFRWGVSSAANSVEGFNLDSDWWAWEQEPGRIRLGHTSGVALGWWKNPEADFDLASEMGFNALRLSIEWARVEPGPEVFDEVVLQRYAEILQALRARGIEPMVTLHHFSNPLWVAEGGGWASHKMVALFSRYVRHVADALSAHCDFWCTMNDPNLYAYMAYGVGAFAPGKSDPGASVDALRTMIEAHAAAYEQIHAVQPKARVGLSHNVRPLLPADPHDREDRRAVERANRAYNLSIVEALARGRWLPPLGVGLAPRMHGKLDWIGLSYYGRDLVQSDGNRRSLLGRCIPGRGPDPLDGGLGEFYPQGLFEAIQRLSRLRLPIYVTENGIPDEDDDLRPRYILAHLHEVWRALQLSYPVAGYYHRTLVDSFEWSEGWTQRFGLHSFDPGSPQREARRSAHLMSEVIASGAITTELVDQYSPQLRGQLLPEPGPEA